MLEENICRDYEYFRILDPQCYPDELSILLFNSTGEILNLDHPKSLNAKIQWLKLYDNTPLKTKLADKYLVRAWIAEQIGEEYLVQLLGVWDSFDDIDFDTLPNSFVLKTNHSSDNTVIVREKALLDKTAAKYNFDYWLSNNYALRFLELHYADIQPKIIAEEYLENTEGDLRDYKVLCFNGHAQNILYIQDRNSIKKQAFFDLNWNKLSFTHDNISIIEEDIPKPEKLDLMINLAEKLSADFALVRVDFYILNNGDLKFGEMTFTPADGKNKWQPEDINMEMGAHLRLPDIKMPLPDKNFADRGIKKRIPGFVRQETDIKKQNTLLKKQITELEKEKKSLEKINAEQRNALSSIKKSKSYTIGRIITWFPRKIRKLCKKWFIAANR
jgi:hypothetical protein